MTPGSGVSPVAPAAAPASGPAAAAPVVRPPPSGPSEEPLGFDVSIDTEPPGAMMVQSGETAPPPPELAALRPVPVGVEAVPGPAPVPDPTPVDFDALHAALGEGSREAAPPAATPTPQVAPATATAKPKAGRPAAAGSEGQTNAAYASSRAQAPPAAHIDVDLQAPAVIVAQDDVAPPPAQMMTTPMAPPVGAMNPRHPASGPHQVGQVGPPSSGGMRAISPHAAPSHLPTGNTPQAFDPVALGLPPIRPGQPLLTMRMPERPRRPRTPTVVVRSRGPSTRQKLFVFAMMLLLVSVIGIGFVMWRAPQLFGFGPKAQPAATTKPAPPPPPAVTTATATATASTAAAPAASAPPPASAPPSASASAPAPAPAKPGMKPKGR